MATAGEAKWHERSQALEQHASRRRDRAARLIQGRYAELYAMRMTRRASWEEAPQRALPVLGLIARVIARGIVP